MRVTEERHRIGRVSISPTAAARRPQCATSERHESWTTGVVPADGPVRRPSIPRRWHSRPLQPALRQEPPSPDRGPLSRASQEIPGRHSPDSRRPESRAFPIPTGSRRSSCAWSRHSSPDPQQPTVLRRTPPGRPARQQSAAGWREIDTWLNKQSESSSTCIVCAKSGPCKMSRRGSHSVDVVQFTPATTAVRPSVAGDPTQPVHPELRCGPPRIDPRDDAAQSRSASTAALQER